MLKKQLLKTFILVLFASLAYRTTAQVAIGVTPYTTLKAAFDAINSGAQTGSIAIVISGNTSETASCVLNSNGVGAAAYSDVSITTSGAGPYTISGTLAATHLIDLNGADNVTIDGGSKLTISNGGTGVSSAIRLINDATNNMIKNVTLLGSASTNTAGVVTFGNAAISGNDFNTLDNCNISGAGANLPINCIFSLNATAATDNSNNIVNNCRISNFFNAAAGSCGLNINVGSSDWTITNNKLFQTASRTYTTAAAHHGVLIGAGKGYVITSNTIGYSSATGTGTYTMLGTVANAFYGIRFTTTTTSLATMTGTTGQLSGDIQGNTITNISIATGTTATTAFGGILISGLGNFDIGTVTGNIIGAATGNGAISINNTITGSSGVGILSSAAGTVNIKNNVFGSITLTGSSATIGTSFTAISATPALLTSTQTPLSGTYNITFNTIGSATTTNSINAVTVNTSNTQGITGMNLGLIAGTTLNFAITTNTTISDNILANFNGNGTSTTNTCRGILYQGTGKAMIERNQIYNFTSATANTTQATAVTAIEGIAMTQNSTASVVNNNNIHTLVGTNTGTTGVTVAGIGSSNPGDAVISNNKIYDLRNASNSVTAATPSFAIGIIFRAALGSGITIANNMISLGNGQTTNTQYVGILNSFNTSLVKAYYNTINIEGTVAAGASPSFAFLRWDNSLPTASALATAVDFKNNILNNTRSGGTGKHYIFGNNYPNATITTIGWGTNATNYNVVNANSATIGFWGADKDFNAWKGTAFCDNQSLSGVTATFANTATGDLHMNMGVAQTAIESGGTTVAGYTTDYDGDLRGVGSTNLNGGGTAPDMGADEFDGTPKDLVAPVITIPTLAYSCVTTGRTITATITDFSGVPTTGTLMPRIYFRKGQFGTWYSEPGVNTAGSGTSGTWDFTITHTTVGGVVAGDFIYYYIVAQDLGGNLGSNPGGVVATDVNTVTTPPTAARYQIGYTTLSGTFQVGSTQFPPFNTLANAVDTWNAACAITGPVVFELTDANYSTDEVFPIVINPNPNASGTNTLTIKPALGNVVTISGATNGIGLIRCLNNFTTIDGSNNGGSGRNMSFINTGTGFPRVIEFSSTATTPITDCTLKNCNITNGNQNSSAITILDINDNAGLFNNITIQNNKIEKAYIGVYANGVTNNPGNGSGTLFVENTLNSAGTNAIRLIGLYLQGIDGGEISFNTIGNLESANAESDRGIWLASGTINTRVEGNTITGLNFTGTGAFGQIGINVTPSGTLAGNSIVGNTINNLVANGTVNPIGISMSSGSNSTIENNTITSLTSTGTGAGAPIGISVSTAGSGINVIKNTVSTITSAGSTTPAAISVTGGTNHKIDANKITNVKNPNTGGWGAAGMIVSSSSTNVVNNMVSDVAAYGFAGNTITDNGYGIAITGGSGNNVFHNSVLMNTNQTDITGLPAPLLIASSVTAVSVQNNILVNAQTLGTERYAIISEAPSTAFTAIDNNDYYTTGPNLGRVGTTNTATLVDMQTGFGGNTNSISENPTFVSATDLHLNMGVTPTNLESKGAVLATVLVDIDGNARPGPVGSVNGGGTVPDIGADEFDGVPIVNVLKLRAKVLLSNADPVTKIMPNLLVLNATNFPIVDPYANQFDSVYTHVANPTVASTTNAVITAAPPAIAASDIIIDWIFVELRTGTSGATVVEYTKSGLLQADGDIVDTDGISPLTFPNAPVSGNFYVTIRHRNHLGFRTNAPIALSPTSPLLDFTNNSVPLYGLSPTFTLSPTVSCMNQGDGYIDGSVDSGDSAKWKFTNGLYDDYFDNSDYNLDSSTDSTDSAAWQLNNGKYQELD
jgi:trimeric autotransporter adhesin